jgi:protein SCO1/2
MNTHPRAPRLPLVAFCAALLAWPFAPVAGAQPARPPAPTGLQPTGQSSVLDKVGIDQKLDARVPLDLAFHDEAGQPVTLAGYVGEKPVILTLVYYGCPGLCTIVLNDVEKSLQALKLNIGESFEVITVSFDPTEKPELAARKKREYVKRHRRPGAERGWHFLTGDEASIRALTDAVGFRYAWDEAQKQYVHPGGIIVLTPGGKISRYFFGIDYAPRDVQLSLVEASGGKIGSPVDKAMLYCFQFNPHTGRYTFWVMNAVRVGGVLMLLALGTFLVRNFYRDRSTARMKDEGGRMKPDAAAASSFILPPSSLPPEGGVR